MPGPIAPERRESTWLGDVGASARARCARLRVVLRARASFANTRAGCLVAQTTVAQRFIAQLAELRFEPFELGVGQILGVDQSIPRLVDGVDQLVELEVDRL